MFTTLTITASSILFKEWSRVTSSDIIGSMCGFAVIICGVFLLHAFKDITMSFKDILVLTNSMESSTLPSTLASTGVHSELQQHSAGSESEIELIVSENN